MDAAGQETIGGEVRACGSPRMALLKGVRCGVRQSRVGGKKVGRHMAARSPLVGDTWITATIGCRSGSSAGAMEPDEVEIVAGR